MYQKLADLKKQAAEIAEQIKQLESQSPEERLRHAITDRLIEEPDPLIDTVFFIMEEVKEYTAVRIAGRTAALEARIAELCRAMDRRDEQIAALKAELMRMVA